jgi:protein Tex
MLLSPTDMGDPLKKAAELLNPEKKFDTVAKVIEGALNIIAQKVIESVNLMDVFLKNAFENGNFTSKKKKGYEGEELRFEDYYDYTEELSRLKNPRNTHRYLAIKGEKT